MKKSTLVTLIVLVIVVVAIIWLGGSKTTPVVEEAIYQSTSTAPVVVAETTKVSAKTSKFENAELGFAVNYPTAWEADTTDTGVSFLMPIDKTQVSTVKKLQADITVSAMKCAFPPVVTVKDRGTITVNGYKLDTISMSNTDRGNKYFNRMYSLQKSGTCYTFAFSSITASVESQKLTGSNKTQAENNNKAIVNIADTAFTDMVKTFNFITGPAGQDETTVAPIKK